MTKITIPHPVPSLPFVGVVGEQSKLLISTEEGVTRSFGSWWKLSLLDLAVSCIWPIGLGRFKETKWDHSHVPPLDAAGHASWQVPGWEAFTVSLSGHSECLLVPCHQGSSISNWHPDSTPPTAAQRRLWAVFKPLTAAPERDLGTWSHKWSKILPPLLVGDVSYTIVAPIWSPFECLRLSWTQNPDSTAAQGKAHGTCLAYRSHS